MTLLLFFAFVYAVLLCADVLWQRLGVLGIDKQRVHDVFGDVRNLVETQFVRELYASCLFVFVCIDADFFFAVDI